MIRTRSDSGILFHNAQGELDLLPLSELEAVECSGRSSWQEYATQPGHWPQETTPVVPLMRARPGATEPEVVHGVWNTERTGVAWSYEELCELMRDHPISKAQALHWGKMHGRTPQAVQAQMSRLRDLLVERKLKWDGERFLRGKNAQVFQWPVGFRNPKH